MNKLCILSKYKDLLGIPFKGAHSYRFLNTATIDYFLSLSGAAILTYFSNIPLVLTTIFTLILGIIFHVLFGIETNSIKFLGLRCNI